METWDSCLAWGVPNCRCSILLEYKAEQKPRSNAIPLRQFLYLHKLPQGRSSKLSCRLASASRSKFCSHSSRRIRCRRSRSRSQCV
ncbi:hypothetical protein VTN02DRAFT_2191 [Thermoascus thermophilus]